MAFIIYITITINYNIYFNDNHAFKGVRGCTELLQLSLDCTIPAPFFESTIF